MKKILTLTIKIYKMTLSPILFSLFGSGCRYKLTCSDYALYTIEKDGAFIGSFNAIKRILSCNSFSITTANSKP